MFITIEGFSCLEKSINIFTVSIIIVNPVNKWKIPPENVLYLDFPFIKRLNLGAVKSK